MFLALTRLLDMNLMLSLSLSLNLHTACISISCDFGAYKLFAYNFLLLRFKHYAKGLLCLAMVQLTSYSSQLISPSYNYLRSNKLLNWEDSVTYVCMVCPDWGQFSQLHAQYYLSPIRGGGRKRWADSTLRQTHYASHIMNFMIKKNSHFTTLHKIL